MKQSLSIVPQGSLLQWINRADQSEVFSFDVTQVSEELRERVFQYGVKQILADGGAVGVNVPMAERIAKMQTRAESLINGTWGTRSASTGLGLHSALFFACVKAGKVSDTPEKREQFKKLTPKQVAGLYRDESIQEHLESEEVEF